MHPLEPKPVYSWEPPAGRRVTDVPPGPDGLRLLALQGGWTAILDRTRGYAQMAGDQVLVTASWHLLALFKLGNYPEAAQLIASLGDLETLTSGESIPFVVRWIHTQLAGRLGRPSEQRDYLYKLLNFCNVQLEDAVAARTPEGSEPLAEAKRAEREGGVRLWTRRRHMTILALAALHAEQAEWVLALKWLNTALREMGGDPAIWERVGHVQLMMGDADAAAASFSKAVRGGTAGRLLARRCSALLAFANGDFPGAAAELDGLLQELPTDTESINNRAICWLYMSNLSEGIRVLEEGLQKGGREAVRETLLRNLSCMYDLYSSGAAAAAKARLTGWASAAGPEDLDLSEVRPPPA